MTIDLQTRRLAKGRAQATARVHRQSRDDLARRVSIGYELVNRSDRDLTPPDHVAHELRARLDHLVHYGSLNDREALTGLGAILISHIELIDRDAAR